MTHFVASPMGHAVRVPTLSDVLQRFDIDAPIRLPRRPDLLAMYEPQGQVTLPPAFVCAGVKGGA